MWSQAFNFERYKNCQWIVIHKYIMVHISPLKPTRVFIHLNPFGKHASSDRIYRGYRLSKRVSEYNRMLTDTIDRFVHYQFLLVICKSIFHMLKYPKPQQNGNTKKPALTFYWMYAIILLSFLLYSIFKMRLRLKR